MPDIHYLTVEEATGDGVAEYVFETSQNIREVEDEELGSNDFKIKHDDGGTTLDGSVKDGYTDEWKFTGDVLDFRVTLGKANVYLDGDEVTAAEVRAFGNRTAGAETIREEVAHVENEYDNVTISNVVGVDELSTDGDDSVVVVFDLKTDG